MIAFDPKNAVHASRGQGRTGMSAFDPLRHYSVRMYRLEDDEEEPPENLDGSRVLARLDLTFVDFAGAIEAKLHPIFSFADAISGDLLQLATAVLDEGGTAFREALEVEPLHMGVLYVEDIAATEAVSGYDAMSHLLEYALQRYSAGCGVGAYFLGPSENIGPVRVLEDRGFRRLNRPHERLWYIDLERRRFRLTTLPLNRMPAVTG